MINSSKLHKKEYQSVKSALSDDLTLALANEIYEFIFDVRLHTEIEGSKMINSFQKNLQKELLECPQVKRVEVECLKDLYECTCHNTCLTINARFRHQKLKCGKKCELTPITYCRKDYVPGSERCRRMRIKWSRKIDDEAMLMRIVLDPDYSSDYSPPHKKSDDSEMSENNRVII